MNHAAIHTVVHTAQELDRRRRRPGVDPRDKTRAPVIPDLDELPEFMLVPDSADPKASLVYALVDGIARYKGRIWFTETYRYGGREYGEGWIAEIPGREDPAQHEHFSDRTCNKSGKATAIGRLVSNPISPKLLKKGLLCPTAE